MNNSVLKEICITLKNEFDAKLLRNIILFCVVFGFMVHGAIFFNDVYSHDGISGFDQSHENLVWKIQLGRFMQFFSLSFRGYNGLAMPLGLISLILMGISVYLIAKTINIRKSANLYFLSAIFITSSAYISTVCLFTHELDAFMFALFFATLSAYTHTQIGHKYLLAPLFLAISCGFYQAYAGVTIMLLMLLIVQQILGGTDIKTTIKSSCQAIITIAIGFAIYFVLYKTIAALTHMGTVSPDEAYGSVDNALKFNFNIIQVTLDTYFAFISRALCTAYPHRFMATAVVNLLLGGYMTILIIKHIIKNKITKWNTIFLLIIFVLMPLGGCIATFLSKGVNTSNMAFAVTIIYVLLFWLHEVYSTKKWESILVYCMLFFIISNSVIYANKLYTNKSIHLKNTQMIMHDIYNNIVSHEAYLKNNHIELAIMGDINLCPQIGYREGLRQKEVIITYPSTYYTFFESYFNTTFTEPQIYVFNDLSTNPDFVEMPCYPNDGYVKTIGKTLVVKFPLEPNKGRWDWEKQ